MSAVLEKPQAIEDFLVMSDAEIDSSIEEARRELGNRVIILGHHYQRDDVIRHADLTGDSYQLSVMASQTEAEYIVFCGVHFMAESADILGKPSQRVILPDLGAGCSMADMATIEQVEDAWEQLRDIGVLESKVAPITYMNSSAAIKAFCGRNEGVVCTSSNAVPLFDIYLKEFDKMFFFPDQHLGRIRMRSLAATPKSNCTKRSLSFGADTVRYTEGLSLGMSTRSAMRFPASRSSSIPNACARLSR
jgi:quinolinate synthase